LTVSFVFFREPFIHRRLDFFELAIAFAFLKDGNEFLKETPLGKLLSIGHGKVDETGDGSDRFIKDRKIPGDPGVSEEAGGPLLAPLHDFGGMGENLVLDRPASRKGIKG